jgi:predicted deacylase
MNPLGVDIISRQVAIGGEDLNRSFPGDKNGSLAQRIAHTIFSEITKTRPLLVLDLHNDWRSSIPYTVLDPYPGRLYKDTYQLVKDLARHTGFLLIQEHKSSLDDVSSHKTLSGSLLLHQVPALTLELGEAYVVNEQNVRYGVKSIWNILAYLEMVEPIDGYFIYPLQKEVQNRFLRYSHRPFSTRSGIIRFLVKPGQIVNKKQPVARIYNAFGKLMETIMANDKAIVLGHSDSSVAYPGSPVMAFGLL